jgi:hypothetical protein
MSNLLRSLSYNPITRAFNALIGGAMKLIPNVEDSGILTSNPSFSAINGTPPSGTQTSQHRFIRLGPLVFGWIRITFSVAGSSVGVMSISLPSGWPAVNFAGFTSASNQCTVGSGYHATNDGNSEVPTSVLWNSASSRFESRGATGPAIAIGFISMFVVYRT